MTAVETTYKTDITKRMRARNGVRFFIFSLLFVGLLTGAGVFHVWYNYEIYTLGHRLAKQTHVHRKLLDETKKLKLELSTLKRSQNLDKIGREKLGLRTTEHRDWTIVK